MITSIAYFCYGVKDMAKAREFYEGILGLKVGEINHEAWLEYEIAGGTFAITNIPDFQSENPKGGTIAFEVDDLQKTFQDFKDKNVDIVSEVFDFPPCNMFVIKDPFGNDVIIHKLKSTK